MIYFARVVIIKLDLRCPVHHRSCLNKLLLLPQNEIPIPSTTIGDCEQIERQLESTVRTLDAVRRTVHVDWLLMVEGSHLGIKYRKIIGIF
jgi:hypothetical protein